MLVLIPSKGRPSTKTYKLLQQSGIPFAHLVEPQDTPAYHAAGVPSIVTIPADNQGIAYVRNFALDHARSQSADWLWLIDDDVDRFALAVKGKTSDTPAASSLIDFYQVAQRYRFPVNGINYRQYAWSYSKKPARYYINRRPAEVCTLLFMPKVTWRYRARLNLKEDRDFCMQAIQHSSGVFLDTHLCFNCPPVGSNPGGLQSDYQAQRDHQAAARLAAQWAPFARLTSKKGRVDCSLDMAAYARSLNKLVR